MDSTGVDRNTTYYSSAKRGFFSFIKKFFNKRNMKDSSAEPSGNNIPEMEVLTDALIAESLALFEKELKRALTGYNRSNNPLGEHEAKEIMMGILSLAVSQRRLLSGRICQSVEEGTLFKQYYGKMKAIDKLTLDAYEKMRRMQAARERFEYQKVIYENVVGKTYSKDFRPKDGAKEQHIEQESWTGLDNEGGVWIDSNNKRQI